MKLFLCVSLFNLSCLAWSLVSKNIKRWLRDHIRWSPKRRKGWVNPITEMLRLWTMELLDGLMFLFSPEPVVNKSIAEVWYEPMESEAGVLLWWFTITRNPRWKGDHYLGIYLKNQASTTRDEAGHDTFLPFVAFSCVNLALAYIYIYIYTFGCTVCAWNWQ